ncbi:MAG: hypothetical protein AABZ64_06635 [Nitrospinota bacterium]
MNASAGPGSTRVVRSWKWTAFSLGVAALTAAGVALLWPKGYGYWALGVALAGVGAAAGIFSSSGAAPCPSCGREITPLAFGANHYVRCPACGGYAEGEGGALWAIEPDRVAGRPEFAIPLAGAWRLPGLCCACGGAAARAERLTLKRAFGRGPFSAAARLPNLSVEAPHCLFHTGGAALDGEATREFSTDAMKGSVTVLRVRSHRFYRAFRELNGGWRGAPLTSGRRDSAAPSAPRSPRSR